MGASLLVLGGSRLVEMLSAAAVTSRFRMACCVVWTVASISGGAAAVGFCVGVHGLGWVADAMGT